MKLLDVVKEIEGKSTYLRFKWITRFLDIHQIPHRIQDYGSGQNILVPAPTRSPCIAISAHFDVVPNSPGANDNASSVAVCLEILLRLKTQQFHKFEVAIFIFDQEENGLIGSKAFLSSFGLSGVVGLINLEMVGMGTKFALWNVQQGAKGTILEGLEQTAALLNLEVRRFNQVVTNSADHVSFRNAGLTDAFTITCISDKDKEIGYHYARAQEFAVDKSVLFEILSQAPIFQHYHKASDLSIYLSEESLQNTTELIWHTLLTLDV